jgi:hypothetical protein
MHTSEQINELATALARAQGEIKGAAKDSANPFFKAKYADLASVWDACRAALTKNGLSVTQTATADGARVSVETRLLHASGQWLGDALTVSAKEESPQAIGSAITYARRYGLAAITGVAPEDDDGEAAQARPIHERYPSKAKPEPKVIPPSSPEAARIMALAESDATQRAAEEIVKQVEAVTAQQVPEHVKPFFDEMLQQTDPRGPNGTHTAEQIAYTMKLLSDGAETIGLKIPMEKWNEGQIKTLRRHFGLAPPQRHP